MEERAIKTHLIVTNIHEEYSVKWHGRIMDTKPVFRNDMPVFVVISGDSRVELNTTDMKRIEDCAKHIARPHGRAAITTATARIYILEEDGNHAHVGTVIHDHIKEYAPMYDNVYYRV